MSSRLAAVVVLSSCSFIYNPSNISGDSGNAVDAEHVVDVNPSALALTYAFPPVVNEGAGQGGARPAVIVVRGAEISPAATVTVVPATGAATQIVVNNIAIAEDHTWIAISISAPVDTMQDETGGNAKPDVPLTVTVDNGNGTVVAMPANTLALHFLDQLVTPPTTPPPAKKLYSMVMVPSATTFLASTSAGRAVITSVSSISFIGEITANGGATVPGPGGCAGGTAAATTPPAKTADGVTCTSSGVGATSILGGGGGGAGYTVAGDDGTGSGSGAGGPATGDIAISSYTTSYAGGGGGGAPTTVLPGSAGGGGGGTVELTSGGDLSVSGGASDAIAALGGTSGGGGGGAGGTILVRCGGALTLTKALDVAPTSGSGNGGKGKPGRTRVDTATGTAPVGVGFTGAMFLTVPYMTTTQTTSDIMITGPAGVPGFQGQVYDKDGNALADGNFNVSFGANSTAIPSIKLTAGYNKVCVIVPNGNVLQSPEAGNCAEIVFLP